MNTENITVTCQDEESQTAHVDSENLNNGNRRLQEEFNMQRAKLKELFLQKEEEVRAVTSKNQCLTEEMQRLKIELDDVRSQLVVTGITLETSMEQEKRRANEEIASLQHFVHESIAESSSNRNLYDSELEKLQKHIEQLQSENILLRRITQEPSGSLAVSNVLDTLTRGFVKRLSTSDSKVNISAADDPINESHVLIESLEHQILALKEKLRTTDEQLQKSKHLDDERQQEITCDMCSNYEAQLVQEQQKTTDLTNQLMTSEKCIERQREDLLKEIGFRMEMEEKWNEKKEEHKQQVATLTVEVQTAEEKLGRLQKNFGDSLQSIEQKFASLTAGRCEIQRELSRLQAENDTLVGRFTVHSQTLQNESINLPDTVEELHEVLLRHHQDLIIAKIGKETFEEQVNVHQYDLTLLREQISTERDQWKAMETNLLHRINSLEKQKRHLEDDKHIKQKLDNVIQKVTLDKTEELQHQSAEFELEKKLLKDQIGELKGRVSSLQQELNTSEMVQKDFVRLSQSLQMQLEKIRESDTEVRWQHLEDANVCPGCRQTFVDIAKCQMEHCRHCGQIFCQNCLVQSVRSGASMRPSKVCDVCHTLLVKSSAPYFSQAPPPLS